MKVGDLVRLKNRIGVSGNVFLIVRKVHRKVWIYPDPDADEGYDHTDDKNYYYDHYFEVLSESR